MRQIVTSKKSATLEEVVAVIGLARPPLEQEQSHSSFRFYPSGT